MVNPITFFYANRNDYLLIAVLDCLIIDPMFVIVTFSVLLVY